MSSLYKPIYKSVIRSVSDLIEDLNTMALIPDTIQYHDWESRGEENNLPHTTLIGTDGFSFNENDGRWIVRYALAISSYRDTNLLNEVDLLDEIEQRFRKGKKIPLLEMVAGDEVGELVVAAAQLFPMAQSELRNYRTIAIELHRTGA